MAYKCATLYDMASPVAQILKAVIAVLIRVALLAGE